MDYLAAPATNSPATSLNSAPRRQPKPFPSPRRRRLARGRKSQPTHHFSWAPALNHVDLIGNSIAALVQQRKQLDLLRQQPDLWPAAIEEILRLHSPVQMTARTPHCDVDIAGQRIRAGQTVAILLGGANHDPTVFPDPDQLDITRPNAREHLAFAS